MDERRTLLHTLQSADVGLPFPRELYGLVVDYGMRCRVYQVVFKPDPLATCKYFCTRIYLPSTKHCWMEISSNAVARFRTYDDEDDIKDEKKSKNIYSCNNISLEGYLDDETNKQVVFSVNNKPCSANLAITLNDSKTFSNLEIDLGDANHHGSMILEPFSPLVELVIKHECNGIEN